LAAADVVILPDGFTLRGKWSKERELIPAQGGPGLVVAKANGFDIIDDGPRQVVFSRHAGKGGKLEEGAAVGRELQVFRTALRGPRGKGKYPPITDLKIAPFNDRWEQIVTGRTARTPEFPNGGTGRLVRQVVNLSAEQLVMDSTTHPYRPQYQTSEFPVDMVRKFLATHPDLKEAAGKPDPGRRLTVVTFLKDVSLTDPAGNGAAYLLAAKQELEKLGKDLPDLDKDVADRADKLAGELTVCETRRVTDELEAAISAGRWQVAKEVVGRFQPSALDAKESLRFATAKATVDVTWQRFDQTARLLDEVIRGFVGPLDPGPLGGGLATAGPLAKLPPTTLTVLDAAVTVREELHPDTAGRLELFVGQADARRRFGGAAATPPESLLALAVSGAAKGKNGADPDPAGAARAWAIRQAALNYLRGDTLSQRRQSLDAFLGRHRPGPDELTQTASLLPPPLPLDPQDIGIPVPPEQADGGVNIVRRQTPRDVNAGRGFDYLLRLPAEYHPGRAYPVIVALADPMFAPERLVGRLQEFADRFGYVVVAPVWAGRFGQRPEYDFTGLDHPSALEVLRDVLRRVRCDPDKVFLFGYGGGADFALDLGLAHPDRFAGVVANGAVPPQWLGTNYWRNAQKLPMYFVCGDLGAEYRALRPLFEKWMVRGFPALATVYRGRGSPDFFPAELPRVFDWLGRKARARGTASLRVGPGGVEPWQVLREADDRFYWVGVGAGGLRRPNMVVGRVGAPEPARFRADVGRNGTVVIDEANGVRSFVVWLERDLIDWSKPLAITVNGKPPIGYKPAVPTPDVPLLFEELYRTGDTKMLFLGKVEVSGPG
jgi:pimeloyl-ACP methyl ester carboxylesterase